VVKDVALQIAAGCLRVDPYPCREPGLDNHHPLPDRSPRNPHPPENGHRGQEDGPFWYFPGLPLGSRVFRGARGREVQGTPGAHGRPGDRREGGVSSRTRHPRRRRPNSRLRFSPPSTSLSGV
jgi:hypothetical protein